MGDYYKTSATVPEPRYGGSPQKQTPTFGRHGRSQPFPNDNDDYPSARDNPQEPATIQRQPRPKTQEPASQTEGHLRPAPVNPTLRQRCQGCEKILRRLLPLILLFFYSLFGGMLFHLVEKEYESETLRQGRSPGRAIVDEPAARQLNLRFTEIVLDSNYTEARRTFEVRRALIWYFDVLDERWRILHNVEKSTWDFVSALFYSVSVYTTIGYGKPAPATAAGRVLTVFYALFGIPLAIVALIQLGYIFACLIWKLWRCIRHGRKRTSRSRGSQWQEVPPTDLETRLREERDDVDALAFPVSTVAVLTFLWMLLIAALFYAWERPRWSYGESLYFIFISLSTIGLGDYKPWSGWGKVLGAILISLGLALLATILVLYSQQLDALYRALERAIEAEYREALTETGEPMASTPLAADDALKRTASRLPFGSRCLYWLMPESRKRSLRRLYRAKAALTNKSMQTDDYLWAMSPTAIQALKTIGEEGRGLYEDAKSRDDVNSLVMMCDYTLPPPYRETKLDY